MPCTQEGSRKMEWLGGNKGPTTGSGVGVSSLEIRTGIFSRLDMYLSPNWMLNRVWSGNHFLLFFRNLQSTSWCFGSHFFVFWLHFFFLRKNMERKLLCQHFTATNCSTLAQHALKLICQTTFDSFLFKFLLSHVGPLSCNVMEDTWPKPRIFSCRRRSCSKHVCFHSNQYFYIPQENVNLSNEQCAC